MLNRFKGFVITVNYLPVDAITIFPFIILKKSKLPLIKSWLQHERIHLLQQAELLIVFFYLFYFANYISQLIRLRSHQKAYRAILFEQEAYSNQSVPGYLYSRKPFAYLKKRINSQ
jgi:hypothetical protein